MEKEDALERKCKNCRFCIPTKRGPFICGLGANEFVDVYVDDKGEEHRVAGVIVQPEQDCRWPPSDEYISFRARGEKTPQDEYVELLIESERGCALRGMDITVLHVDSDGYYSDARERFLYRNEKQAKLALETVLLVAIDKEVQWQEDSGIRIVAVVPANVLEKLVALSEVSVKDAKQCPSYL
jgi:hypothetical protein